MKKTAVIFLIVSFVACLLSGCGRREKMPFNGDIQFHDITAVIPAWRQRLTCEVIYKSCVSGEEKYFLYVRDKE